MKLSKEELKAKVDTLPLSDEEKISLLEDIEDSMEVQESADTSAIDELQAKYDELLQKYKDRFLSGSTEPENNENNESETEESEDEETEDLSYEDLIDEKGDIV